MDCGEGHGLEHTPGEPLDHLLLEEAAETESEDVDEPERARVNAHAIHFLGPLEPADTSLNQVQASPGYHWVPIKSIVDSARFTALLLQEQPSECQWRILMGRPTGSNTTPRMAPGFRTWARISSMS